MWIKTAVLGICLVAAAQESQPGRGVNFYSFEKEAALGAGLAAEFAKRTTPVDSAPVLAYAQSVGARLSAVLPEAAKWSFKVIRDDIGRPTHEPASFPGAHIFVPAGLIEQAADESEFAGMLAHAMAHVAERHGTRMATRGQLADTSSIPLIFMGAWEGLGAGGAKAMIPMRMRSFQRQFEIEADALAVKMMAQAGFDPTALARYIGRTQVDEEGSAMPLRADRLAALERGTAALPGTASVAGSEFAAAKEELRRATAVEPRGVPSLRQRPR